MVGMNRVTQLVGQCAQAEYIIGIAHHDERSRAHRSTGKGAFAFTLIAGIVYPAIFQAAAAQDAHILLAHGCHAFGDPLHCLVKGYHRFLGGEGCLDIVNVEFLVTQKLPAQAPIAVPGGQVLLEDLDQVVEDLDRDVIGSQGGMQ